MITLPATLYDHETYHRVPLEHRWVMNKLALAERLGYTCGPVGTRAPAGVYCLRPTYSIAGMGNGGIRKITVGDDYPRIEGPSGHFWSEWFDGHQSWTDFTDDKYVRQYGGDVTDEGFISIEMEAQSIDVPKFLKGLSKHLLIEHVEGRILEVSFRHSLPLYDMQKIPHPNGWEWSIVLKDTP